MREAGKKQAGSRELFYAAESALPAPELLEPAWQIIAAIALKRFSGAAKSIGFN